jgi:hypothetical protein
MKHAKSSRVSSFDRRAIRARRAKMYLAALVTVPTSIMTMDAFGQISLTGGAYSQNFDTLPIAGDFTFTNNTTIPGWYVARSNGPAAGVTRASDGSGGAGFTGGLYSFGTTGNGERALGSVGSGTTGHFAYGAQFVNNTGAGNIIDSITITYTGEHWRVGDSGALQTMFFNYRVGGSSFEQPPQTPVGSSGGSSGTDQDFASFTHFASLDFNPPNLSAPSNAATPLGGNDASNRTTLSDTIDLSSNPVVNGSNFWIRFYNPNHPGTDHGAGVDDFQITYHTTSIAGTDTTITTPNTSYSVGRIMAASGVSVSLHKTGSQRTTFTVTGAAGSPFASGAGLLDTGPVDKDFNVGFTSTGTFNSTVTVHNAASGSAGALQGTADPDDVVTLQGTALNDRVVSGPITLGKTLLLPTPIVLHGSVTFSTAGTHDQATDIILPASSTVSGTGNGPGIGFGVSGTINTGTSGDVLFNDAAITETRTYDMTPFRSGTNTNSASLSMQAGESVPGQNSSPAATIIMTNSAYQPAALTVTGANPTVNVNDTITITNAASTDNSTFGLRAGARVSALTIDENGFKLATGSTSFVSGSPTSGTVIGSPSGNNTGGTVNATVTFSGANKLNGTYDSQIALQFQHSDQTILGTAAHDLADSDFAVTGHAVNSLNAGDTHAGSYTFTGGTFVAQPTINLTGSWTQSGGKATFGNLLVGPTGLAKQTAGRSAARTDVIGSLTISAGGKFDTADQDLVLTGTPIANVKTMIAGGAANNWTGSGLTSSAAAAAASTAHPTALGFANAGSLSISNFNNISVNPTDVLVRYTYAGDANLDGLVSSGDFNTLATNFNGSGKSWLTGDFNYDGVVNALDFNLVAVNFGAAQITTPAGAALGSLVPEPSSMLLGLAGLALLHRKRRR